MLIERLEFYTQTLNTMSHRNFRRTLILLQFAFLLLQSSLQAQVNPYQYGGLKHANYAHVAAASAHPLASEVGSTVMKQGGNAVDAAIAMQWALAVVYPGAGNIGGGGFMVARLANGKELTIDYREMAPASAHHDMYIDEGTGKANLKKSQLGHLASGVPGTVAGLFAAHKYAKLTMRQLIAPAILLAEKGFVITEAEARGLNGYASNFKAANTIMPVFLKDGGWKAGDTLVQKDLAETLKRIQQHGADGFYKGKTAKLVADEMKRGGGIITEADMGAYKAKERQPLRTTYRGYEIVGMPPPSSGGVLLAQMLAMLEPYRLDSLGLHSAAAMQLIIEAERLAYADRAEHLGDADFYPVPTRGLMDRAYARERFTKQYTPGVAGKSTMVKAGVPAKQSEETTHLSVADAEGNVVAVTTTLNGGYGSCTVVGGAGFLLNNEMDDFSVQPGVPNMYGALGGEANAIAAGKRMLSSMTPTLVLKDGKPFMVVGTPGGTTIITSVLQSILHIIDFQSNAMDAVNLPKFHHQWYPDVVAVENDFEPALLEQLKAMGYTLAPRGSIGRVELILRSPRGGWEVVADKRGDDSVAGY